jgi:hypothetical protein
MLGVDNDVIRVTDLLRERHVELDRLFERADGPIGSRELALLRRELATRIGAYIAAEVEVLYPACAEALNDREAMRKLYGEVASLADGARRLLDDGAGRADPVHTVEEVRKSVEQHLAADEGELFPKIEPVIGDKQLEFLGAEAAVRWDDALAEGPEVTLAGVDPRDLDWRAMRLRPRRQRRTIPMKLESEVRKDGSAALRHAAHNEGGRRLPREDRRTRWKTGTQKMRRTLQTLGRWIRGQST